MEKDLLTQITKTDAEIFRLLNARLALIKSNAEKSGASPSSPAARREALYAACGGAGKAEKSYLKQLAASLYDVSAAYESSLTPVPSPLDALFNTTEKAEFPLAATVACQGTDGSYAEAAADKLFPAARLMHFRTFEGVFSAVEKGLCEYGVLPVENSTAGSVTAVYDLMRKSKFYIARAARLRVNHVLMGNKGADLKGITEIFSHEQALSQCGEFLKGLTGVRLTACGNTADAARLVAESGRTDVAAIASENCLSLYGLTELTRNIQNAQGNYTRFICISRSFELYAGANKISVMLSAENKPGALYSLLAKFAAANINLTKLESRPVPGTDFEFVFYLDFEGNIKTAAGRAVKEITAEYKSAVFFGNYSEVL